VRCPPEARVGAAGGERLSRLYYKPVYRFFQRVLGLHGDDLADVTRDFFVRFLEIDFPGRLRREGSFRAFLRVAARRHGLNWKEKHRARAGRLDGRPPEYAEIAEEIGRSVFDVRNYLNRIRGLFRKALAEVAAERSPDPGRDLEELGLAAYKP
jgi:DNA-directed RNA polymerase specialized sigma24 family protein